MADFGTFDFKKLDFILGVTKLEGFSDGSALTIKEVEPTFKTKIGADSSCGRIKNSANYLELNVKLLQTSGANQILTVLHEADKLGNAPLPLIIKDGSGTSLVTAANAWITGYPEIEYGNDLVDRSWTVHASDYVLNLAGN